MEVANSFITVLDELCKKFGLVVDWTQQNVQPYVQELMSRIIKYEIFKNLLGIVISVLILTLVGFCIRAIIKNYKNKVEGYGGESYRIDMFDYAPSLFLVFPMLIGFFMLARNVISLAKCITVPELIFLQMLQNLT